MRSATIVNGVLRKTTQDMELKGGHMSKTLNISDYSGLTTRNQKFADEPSRFVSSGFVIPKGWRIYVYMREINYDPFLYEDPLTFNPWRWLQGRSKEAQQNFMLFGGGSRLCPGKELGLLEISTFLHYFVTRYRSVVSKLLTFSILVLSYY